MRLFTPELRAASVVLALLLGPAALPCTASADEMYRWIDAQGNLHLSETPPPGQAAEPWEPAEKSAIQQTLPTPAPPREQRTARQAPAAQEAPEKVAGQTEDEWRQRALEHQQRIEQLEHQIEQVEAGPDFHSTHFSRNGYADSGTSKQAVLMGLRAELERAQSHLESFEEHARTAGVPPGWLR
jgi:hypothetical protein